MDFYSKISVYKKNYKLTNKVLGDFIGKNESAFAKSLERGSLADVDIKKLEKVFEQLDSGRTLKDIVADKAQTKPPVFLKIGKDELCNDGEIDNRKVALYMIQAWPELVKYPEVKMIIENIELRAESRVHDEYRDLLKGIKK